MKSKKYQLPNSLAKIAVLDFFKPEDKEEAAGGGTMVASVFDATDFQVISSHPAHPGTIYEYTELHLDSLSAGGNTPIKHQDDPERVMFVSGLPPVGANWTMSLTLSKEDFSDTLKMKRFAGNFDTLRVDLGDKFPVIFEEREVFFTVKISEMQYETYVNVNMDLEVAQVIHSDPTTFDQFGISLLGRSNG
jgi:hypothetical protein